MSNAHHSPLPDDNIEIHSLLRQMQLQLKQQQNHIHQLEAATIKQDGKVVFKTSWVTTLKLYDKLLEEYPAISEPNFFDAELPKDHEAFDWNDFHYTDGSAKCHEADLVTVQGYMANTTWFYGTFAHEIIDPGEADSDFSKRTLGFLNTVHISAANDTSRISRLWINIYYDTLGIKDGNNKERSLPTLEALAATKAAAELVRKTYRKSEPPKDRTKKPDNKFWKDKSGTDDKPKQQQTGKL
ncbi:hypothetical protein CPC16_009193 [Podila verticillata]|nr:hypothetical protein CPC16_009193 [Podila verticillata]